MVVRVLRVLEYKFPDLETAQDHINKTKTHMENKSMSMRAQTFWPEVISGEWPWKIEEK